MWPCEFINMDLNLSTGNFTCRLIHASGIPPRGFGNITDFLFHTLAEWCVTREDIFTIINYFILVFSFNYECIIPLGQQRFLWIYVLFLKCCRHQTLFGLFCLLRTLSRLAHHLLLETNGHGWDIPMDPQSWQKLGRDRPFLISKIGIFQDRGAKVICPQFSRLK